jgi:hypothetical protein
MFDSAGLREGMSFGINRISTPMLQLLFWAFAKVMGHVVSRFLVFRGIARAGLLCYDGGLLGPACGATRRSALWSAFERSDHGG